ncbi:MAG: site-2 protease family protein [Planctomycetota bacterium]
MDGWWVESMVRDGRIVELVAWIFWVLLSITLHELAHGWAAIWQGDRTPIQLGRMTANPVVHMGVPSLILFALCGVAWGVMPVQPANFRSHKWGRLFVSAAGPLINLALALICLIATVVYVRATNTFSPLASPVGQVMFTGLYLNLALFILNMLPVPPLDGSTILGAFSFRIRMFYAQPQAAMIGLFALIIIFFWTPIGDLIFGGIAKHALEAVHTLTGFNALIEQAIESQP